jgi:hypothetical protein
MRIAKASSQLVGFGTGQLHYGARLDMLINAPAVGFATGIWHQTH